MRQLRFLATAALAATAFATPAAGQLVTFGSIETAGHGQGLALLGASLSRGGPGISPVAQLVGYRYEYETGVGSESQSTLVFAPSAGLKYQTPVGMLQGTVGRAFVDDDDEDFVGGIAPAETRGGWFTTAQYEFWGDGSRMAQLIGSYNWDAEYYWTRARGGLRLAPGSRLVAGAEASLQGGADDARVFSVGPLLQVGVTPALRLTGVVGYRAAQGLDGTGYARLDFAWIPSLGR